MNSCFIDDIYLHKSNFFMKKNFTPNQLIQFLYRETSATDTLGIREELQSNLNLREEFDALNNAYQQLPKVTFSPKGSSIQNILRYSERTAQESCCK